MNKRTFVVFIFVGLRADVDTIGNGNRQGTVGMSPPKGILCEKFERRHC